MLALFKDVLPIIEHSAPLLADALGSPYAGLALNALLNHFNAASVGELIAQIGNDIGAHDKLAALNTSVSQASQSSSS